MATDAPAGWGPVEGAGEGGGGYDGAMEPEEPEEEPLLGEISQFFQGNDELLQGWAVTALHLAAGSGDDAQLAQLLEVGDVHPDSPDAAGRTPVIWVSVLRAHRPNAAHDAPCMQAVIAGSYEALSGFP